MNINMLDSMFKEAERQYEMGDYQHALESFQALASEFPDNPYPVQASAKCLYQLGVYDRALHEAKRSLEMDGELAFSHMIVADSKLRQGELEDALHHTEWSLKLSPDLPEAHLIHGEVLMKMGLLENSEMAFRRAIEICPNSSIARELLINNYLLQGKRNDARKEAIALLLRHPGIQSFELSIFTFYAILRIPFAIFYGSLMFLAIFPRFIWALCSFLFLNLLFGICSYRLHAKNALKFIALYVVVTCLFYLLPLIV